LSKLGRTIPSYTRDIQKTSKEFEKKLARVKYFYWTSFYQFQTYQKHFPKIINHPEKIHLCGLGKTFEQFQQNSYYPTPIFSINNFLSRNKNEL
jgi:hypothetical protein